MEYDPALAWDAIDASVNGVQLATQVLVYVEPPSDMLKALLVIFVGTFARIAQHALATNVHLMVHVPPSTEIEDHPTVTYLRERYCLKKTAVLFTGSPGTQRPPTVVSSLPCLERGFR